MKVFKEKKTYIILLVLVNCFIVITGNSQNQNSIGLYNFKKGKEFYATNYDSSELYYLKSIPYLKKELNVSYLVEAYNGLSAIGYYKREIDKFKKFLFLAYEEALFNLPDTNVFKITTIGNLGAFYHMKGDFQKSISQYKKALDLAVKSKNLTYYLEMLHTTGAIYASIHDYSNAINFFRLELEARLNIEKKNNDELGDVYFSIGNSYRDIGNLRMAERYYKLSHSIYSELKKGDYINDRIIQIYKNLAFVYLENDNIDSTYYFIEKILSIPKIENSRYEYLVFEILGKCYLKVKKIDLAKDNFENALWLVLKKSKTKKIVHYTARQYTNLASLEYDLANYEEALINYQKALTHLFYNFEEGSEYANPSSLQVARPLDGIQALEGKAKTLYQLYLQNQELKDLELSLATNQFASRLIQKTRQDIMTSGSKQLLAGEVLPVYEGAIQTALKLHEVTGNSKYLEEAFQFAESNKAILLLESINEQVAKNYGGIPDTLQERERDLRIDIAFYEKTISKEKQKGEKGDADKISEWEKNLFDLKQAYSDLVDLLETEYPKYYKFKYDTKLADLQTIQQQLLDRKSVLLEYFVGEKSLFLFRITKEDFQVFAYPKDEVYEEGVQKLLDAINTPATQPEKIESFATISNHIYESYLAPAMADLPAEINRLIIIPDDRLTYVPFEVLLQEPLEEDVSTIGPGTLAYLMKKYLINYSYSSTLLLNSQKDRKHPPAPKPLLAMAPSFTTPLAGSNRNCTNEALYSLQCSPLEAETIGGKFKGEFVLGKEANKEHFIQKAEQYKILHLATHSCTDEENPMLSKIYFSNGDLSNYDLYNMELNADLAVLSSCNTGSGKLVQGEGVMSLSKGFIHAGCPSTLISLWSVDDCATSEIMISFYHHLDKGLSKDGALRMAKLDYLDKVDKLHQHPYYWAAFVQMGNFDPLESDNWLRSYYWVVLLTVVIGAVIWKKKRKQQAA